MKPLTQQLSAAIMASSGKFASEDFFYLCDACGMVRNAAAKQIRALLLENKIELAGLRQRQGVRGLPLYKVVGRPIKPAPKQKVVQHVKLGPQRKELSQLKGSVDKYYRRLTEKEKHDKVCADRLDAAMRGKSLVANVNGWQR